MNPLPKAANQGDCSRVERLLNVGPASQSDLDLALARACCMGHLDVAQLLYDHGANPNGPYPADDGSYNYGSILLASCEFLNVDGITFLLARGADPNGHPPESGLSQTHSPLSMVQETYEADEARRQQCRQLLLDAGAR